MRRNERGFTLMELMVVIVIVAILAAVAVPLYINYVRDAQRTEAKGAVGAVITAEQTFYQTNGTYTDDTFIPNPSAAPDSTGQKLNCDLSEALRNWTIDVTGANATGFRVNAVGNASTPAANLEVHYNYSRDPATPSTWEEK